MKHRLSRRWFSVVSNDIINNDHGEHDDEFPAFHPAPHSQSTSGRGWLRTPCTSWSRARRNDGHGLPPLRSDAQLWGLRNLTAQDEARVDTGNSLARFSFKVFQDCVLFDVPVALENPSTSRLCLLPVVCKVCKNPSVSFCVKDYCQDGAPWPSVHEFCFLTLICLTRASYVKGLVEFVLPLRNVTCTTQWHFEWQVSNSDCTALS